MTTTGDVFPVDPLPTLIDGPLRQTQGDSSPKLGRYRVDCRGATPEQAKQIESRGDGAIWVGGSPACGTAHCSPPSPDPARRLGSAKRGASRTASMSVHRRAPDLTANRAR